MKPSLIFSDDIKSRHCEYIPAALSLRATNASAAIQIHNTGLLRQAYAFLAMTLFANNTLSPVGRGRPERTGEGQINIHGFMPLTQPSPHGGEGLRGVLCALCVSAVIIFSSLPAQAADPGDACTAAQADAWIVSDSDHNIKIHCDGSRWRILEKIDESGAATSRIKQVITFGNDTATCNSDAEGTIRYNGTAKCIELCNATSWDCIAVPACADMTPDGLTFIDLANQALSTLVTSNIVEVSGLGCLVNASISGEGSPEYRICSDAACSSVTQDWTSGTVALADGDYVQLHLTTSVAGGDTHTAHFFAGNAADVWDVTTAGDCTGTPAVGTVCADGTVYAGMSPDAGYVKMYVSRCDAGMSWNGSSCSGTRFALSWNNGIYDPPWTTTGYMNTNTGRANTTGLAALSDAGSPYLAAQFCENLDLNGHTDWYLPAKNELAVIYDGKDIIANFNTSGTYYWSSSEGSYVNAWRQRFSDGAQTSYDKTGAYAARCARR